MTHDCQNHNEGVMELTHDPLCHWSTYIWLPPEALTWLSRRKRERFRATQDALCQCKLIAKVREDERNRCIEDISSFYASGDNTEWWRGFGRGLTKGIELLHMGKDYGP